MEIYASTIFGQYTETTKDQVMATARYANTGTWLQNGGNLSEAELNTFDFYNLKGPTAIINYGLDTFNPERLYTSQIAADVSLLREAFRTPAGRNGLTESEILQFLNTKFPE